MYTLDDLYQQLGQLTTEQRQQPARILGETINKPIDGVWVLSEDHINPTGEVWEPASAYANIEDSDFGVDGEPVVGKKDEIYLTVADHVPASTVPDSELPTNLEESVAFYLPAFEEIKQYANEGEDAFAAFCHSQLSGGIGMHIRNDLKLWQQETPLHQYFLTEHNLFHPDEMSDLIIRHIYRKMMAT